MLRSLFWLRVICVLAALADLAAVTAGWVALDRSTQLARASVHTAAAVTDEAVDLARTTTRLSAASGRAVDQVDGSARALASLGRAAARLASGLDEARTSAARLGITLPNLGGAAHKLEKAADRVDAGTAVAGDVREAVRAAHRELVQLTVTLARTHRQLQRAARELGDQLPWLRAALVAFAVLLLGCLAAVERLGAVFATVQRHLATLPRPEDPTPAAPPS